MKFTCERCGKKYATAEDPAPGRVYKLKCKSCGHLIVVKASSAAMPPPLPTGADVAVGSSPDLPPELQLGFGSSESAPPPGNGAFALEQPGDETSEISVGPGTADSTPAAPGSGYVDLFADSGADQGAEKQEDPFLAAARASLPDGYGGGGAQVPDPFQALRDDSGSDAHTTPPAHSQPAMKIPAIPKPAAQKSSLPIALIGAGVAVLVGILVFTLFTFGKKPAQPGAQPPVAQAPAAKPVEPAPVEPAPPPPVAAQPAPAPVAAQPATPAAAAAKEQSARAAEERNAREEQRRREKEEAKAREKQAKEERAAKDREAKEARAAKDREAKEARVAKDREAKEARDREKAERTAKDREAREAREREKREAKEARDREKADRIARERAAKDERDRAAREAKERDRADKERAASERAAATAAVDAEGGLSTAQVEKVIASTKKAFDGCIKAAKGDVKLDGRKVLIRLNIQNNGAVTYPTLDDVTLNATDLGQCLKNASRLMVFPKFKGDTMHVEVPLALTAK